MSTQDPRAVDIAARLEGVRARVRAACAAAGRDEQEVRLIAVSKTRPLQDVLHAAAAGQVDFGENYAQELRDKGVEQDGLSDAPLLRWHFIGHLQRNKVRYVAGRAALIHTVDSLRLAQEIGKRAESPQGVLVQINVGDEDAKSGAPIAGALDLCEAIAALPGVDLQGLMCIPPAREQAEEVGPFFAILAELAQEGRQRGLPLRELSMGMSSDFEVAIRHGATLVRVGTAIFGHRG
ncbi:MAG: YggS family pyridoxal phosphate-dependent enzyme [Alphaproteobacteria bacterium]|nr:YggS family pyridoxal phosphate-dependent enzyme [Alphaproteobacteria bacterium]MCB9794499.1 YggS family pyridoxal phosphate-dependent enzyme [Alphaproteobacteria bacterium]